MSNPAARFLYNSPALRAARALALPQRCALCAAAAGAALVCAACDAALPRPGPACPRCALPAPGGTVCGPCLARPPPYAVTRAAFVYAFPADRLVQALKYGGALAHADFLAGALAAAVAGGDAEVVVPMPLSSRRQRARGFNQANEIAGRVARRLGLPAAAALVRVRDAPAQAGSRRRERLANPRGAFVALPAVAGRRIAIVDDVMTTGATMAAAAHAALAAGAGRVEAWVVARTLPPS
ncbi:MAG: ComF family protein [Burkholderiales bacterium]|nr:ComF family protein [Burkholderiales bacterium]